MRERWELQQKQSLPLGMKIKLTQQRIREWVDTYGEDGVYISFSGGKDSTVLLDIARKIYPNLKAVFFDTGLEYPEIRKFVKTFDNVDWVKPSMTFKQIIDEYGYPFISKEVAECVSGAKKYLTRLIDEESVLTDRQTDRQTEPEIYLTRTSSEDYSVSENIPVRSAGGYDIEQIINSPILKEVIEKRSKGDGARYRLARVLGILAKDNKVKADLQEKDRSAFSQTKWKFLLAAPFDITQKCCNVMKKNPSHKYTKETGRYPITAQMASESRLRTQKWLQHGCNAFDATNPISNPMSFWFEQDVLLYIKKYGLKICSVYGDIVTEDGTEFDAVNYEDRGIFELDRPVLKTTGCSRTGCMFCGFGCHLEKDGDGRFERMKITHPNQYNYIMRPKEEGGLDYKNVIDWINEHGNTHIKY